MNIEDFNLELIKDRVGTQYGDCGGYIEIDGHHPSDLFKLCADHGLDMEKYFLIGLSAGEHTMDGVGRRDIITFTAILMDTVESGKNLEEIKKYLRKNNGKANAVQKSFEVKYADLGKYIKRVDFAVVTSITANITRLEIEEEY